jgi:predicted GNAT family N-acyltransferase
MPDLLIQLIHHGSQPYEETVALRDDVLRKPLGLSFTPEGLATEASDYHVACYRDGRLAGCLILTPAAGNSLKMRQVAVAEGLQGQGIGTAMVAFSERFARERNISEITMHARESAVPFYERLGYELFGERFEEVTIPHWKMRKRLQHIE